MHVGEQRAGGVLAKVGGGGAGLDHAPLVEPDSLLDLGELLGRSTEQCRFVIDALGQLPQGHSDAIDPGVLEMRFWHGCDGGQARFFLKRSLKSASCTTETFTGTL